MGRLPLLSASPLDWSEVRRADGSARHSPIRRWDQAGKVPQQDGVSGAPTVGSCGPGCRIIGGEFQMDVKQSTERRISGVDPILWKWIYSGQTSAHRKRGECQPENLRPFTRLANALGSFCVFGAPRLAHC